MSDNGTAAECPHCDTPLTETSVTRCGFIDLNPFHMDAETGQWVSHDDRFHLGRGTHLHGLIISGGP